jgi:hypothetical protein
MDTGADTYWTTIAHYQIHFGPAEVAVGEEGKEWGRRGPDRGRRLVDPVAVTDARLFLVLHAAPSSPHL